LKLTEAVEPELELKTLPWEAGGVRKLPLILHLPERLDDAGSRMRSSLRIRISSALKDIG
jgi:hypothetical protein